MARKFNYTTKTFKEFLSFYNHQLAIPYYQRKFVWSEKENRYVLEKFIRDIVSEFENHLKDQEYFIGNFAMCRSSVNYIVDGRQRLTSLVIFLRLLGKKLNEDTTKYLNVSGNFLFSGEDDSSEDLKNGLFGSGATPGSNISEAINIIVGEVRNIEKRFDDIKLKELFNYILNCVFLSIIEYNDEKDALRYFINMNSLTVSLKENEIFYAFVSQLISITKSPKNIYKIKSDLEKIDKDIKQVDEEDLIFVFLKAYFDDVSQDERRKDNKNIKENPNKDTNIVKLDNARKVNSIGVGKWLIGFKMELLSNPAQALSFINSFSQYTSDLKEISDYLTGNTINEKYQSIYFLSLFNKFTKNKYLINILEALFTNRNNYSSETIFKDDHLDLLNFESFCKACNATIIRDYFETSPDRFDPSENIKAKTVIKSNWSFTLKRNPYENIWSLNYPEDIPASMRIRNNRDEIQFIFAICEAYLNHIADPNFTMNFYFSELLDSNKFTIEHLFSKKDYNDSERLKLWNSKGKFNTEAEFHYTRSAFENLSLLNRNSNSSAKDKKLYEKIFSYKSARTVTQYNHSEFLIQSLVKDSDFYNNELIKTLGLPKREIELNSDNVTWKHSSHNKEFMEKLCELAVKELFKS